MEKKPLICQNLEEEEIEKNCSEQNEDIPMHEISESLYWKLGILKCNSLKIMR